jgi:hypothetical protein
MSRARSSPCLGTSVTPLERRCLLSAISFEQPQYYPAGLGGPGAEHVAVGDFNGDGAPDLVVAGDDTTVMPVERHTVRVLLGRGDGTFAPPSEASPVGTHTSGVVAGDFNGDGRLDAAVVDGGRLSEVYVLPGNGDGTFGPAQPSHAGAGAHASDIAVADFNEDGRLDLALAAAQAWTPYRSTAPPMDGGVLLLGNGDGTFQDERYIPTGGLPQHFVEAGDINGDGHVDTVFGQVIIGPGDFAAPESRVFGSVAFLDEPARPPTTVPAAITGLKLADLNGDGRLDVAASAMGDFMSTGAVACTLAGLGDGRFAAAKAHELQTTIATDIAVADFDADGRPDLAVAGDDPRWGRPMPVPAAISLQNNGGETFGPPQFHPLPGDVQYPGRLTTGLFNHDRLPDVAVALPGSNRVGVLVNGTRAIFPLPVRLRTTRENTALMAVTRFTITGQRSPASAFAARIHWGDGTAPTAGRVEPNLDGSFTVFGSHAYARPGTYRVRVLITWPEAEVSRVVSGVARVVTPRPVPTVRRTYLV